MQISNSNINYINGDGDDHLKSIQPIRSYLLLLIMLVNILRSVPYSHKEFWISSVEPKGICIFTLLSPESTQNPHPMKKKTNSKEMKMMKKCYCENRKIENYQREQTTKIYTSLWMFEIEWWININISSKIVGIEWNECEMIFECEGRATHE